MNQRIYNLNPQFYLRLWNEQKTIKKSPFDFKRNLQKALSGNYTSVLFDESFLYDDNLCLFVNECFKKGIQPILQVTSQSFRDKKEQLHQLSQKNKNSLMFNIVFDNIYALPLKDIKNFSPKVFFTYIVTKKNRNISFKEHMPKELFEKTRFYFPYKESFFDIFLTPRQVYKFVKKQGAVQPFQGEVYDNRIAQDMDLEPFTLPFAENKTPQTNKKMIFSIIIPSYNNGRQLINTLKNLALQNYPRDEYEITVVDDGSTDNTKKALRNFIGQYPSLNLKAIHFPRVVERTAGDARFRAGLARNLGVKYSKGEILAFLDADILVPPDYLQRLEREHRQADVILLQRYHLKTNAPLKDLFFNRKKIKSWYYIEEKSYWGNFYKKGFDKVKIPWKYICTYGLSLSKKDFQSVGVFGKNFIFYGFEDTDLGYRLFKQSKKFLLSDIQVYHQAPSQKQHRQSPLYRHGQLSKTAKIFFYRHLEPEIYEEMKTYMTQPRGFYYYLPFLRNLFS